MKRKKSKKLPRVPWFYFQTGTFRVQRPRFLADVLLIRRLSPAMVYKSILRVLDIFRTVFSSFASFVCSWSLAISSTPDAARVLSSSINLRRLISFWYDESMAELLLSSLTCAVFLTLFARLPNFRLLTDSWNDWAAGLMVVIKVVRQFPPRL